MSVKNIKVTKDGNLEITYPSNIYTNRIEVARGIEILTPDKTYEATSIIHTPTSAVYEFNDKYKLTVCIDNKTSEVDIDQLLPLIDFDLHTVASEDFKNALYVSGVEYEYLTMQSTYAGNKTSEFVSMMLDKLKDYKLIYVGFYDHNEYMYSEKVIEDIQSRLK